MNTWYKEAIFYHIYPLGLTGAPKTNNYELEPVERLNKIYEWIPHLKYLGINSVYIGPVFEAGTHGYDTTDYYRIDRRLGKNETFKKLVETLHQNGIRVVVDTVFNHVGRDFWAFKEVLENGKGSSYCNWFQNINFKKNSPYNDSFSYDTWKGCFDLVKLNLQNSNVKGYLFSVVKAWINEFDIDGLRMDCADCLDPEFMTQLSLTVKQIKPDFWIMGEVCDETKWSGISMLDSFTNYVAYKGLYSSHNDRNYFEIAHTLEKQFGNKSKLNKEKYLYNFADNHDVNRVASTLKNPSHLYPLHVLLFTMPGIPSIYYGSEWGIEGRKDISDEGLRPELELKIESSISPNKDLAKTIAKLSNIRKNSKALMHGKYIQIKVKHEQFAFARLLEDEFMIIILNSSEHEAHMEFEVPLNGTKAIDILNNNEIFFLANKKYLKMNLYPNWARILILED